MDEVPRPRVSIGLPVYNGEKFLAIAIDSVLAQTFGDFELIISDNASTDATATICQAYIRKDPRVRYLRNERNLGAAPNYNRTFEVSRGEYFKWLAHDDLILPKYLEQTVAALDGAPDAVLCNTLVQYVDEQGRIIGTYDSALGSSPADRPAQRFARAILRSHSCVDFFGLARRSALQNSLLHGSFHGADRAFLAQMALRGRLVHLPQPLVCMREHPIRYTRQNVRPGDRLAWHDARLAGRRHLPTWRVYGEYLRLVRREHLPAAERRRCYAWLLAWWFCNWNAARAAVDLLALLDPRLVAAAERIKTRLFGVAPGHFAQQLRSD